MAKKFDIKIEGLDAVKKMLSELPREMTDKVQRDINKASAKIAREQLEKDSPVGNDNKKTVNKIEGNVIITNSKENKTGVLVGFGKRAFHVRFYERGTGVRQTEKGVNRGQQSANPFVIQSHEKSAPNVIKHFTDNYLQLINKSLKKHAKRLNKK